MKKAFLSVLLLTGFATAGFAQERADKGKRMGRAQQNPEEIVQKRVDTLATRLSLNEEQKAQVYDLNLNRAKKRQVWRNEYNEDLKAQMKEYREAMKADEEKMKEILTEEQYEQYQELRKENRKKMRMRRGGPGKPGGRMPRKEFRQQKPDTSEAGDQ